MPEELTKWDQWWNTGRGNSFVRFESENLRTDGTRFPVSISAAWIKGINEQTTGTIYSIRDETLFKKTEAALEKQLEEAARLNKELEQTNKGIIALWKEIEEKNDALEEQNFQLRKQEQLLKGLVETKSILLTGRDSVEPLGKVAESIGLTIGIDKVEIYKVDSELKDLSRFQQKFAWSRKDGLDAIRDSIHVPFQTGDFDSFPWIKSLERGETVHIIQPSIASSICVPIASWETPWLICCSSFDPDYIWSVAEESMVVSIAESISRTFEKERAEKEYKKYQEELIRNQALLQDIDLARKLRDVVVGEVPMLDQTFTFFKKFRSVGEGGGDSSSFKYYRFGDDKYIVSSVNDQVGHGVEGVLKSILFEYILHQPATYLDTSGSCRSPADQLKIMNRAVMKHSDGPGSSACTAQLLMINTSTLKLTYASAGHHPAILIRADGTLKELDQKGMYMGYFQELDYSQGEVQLYPGDKVIQFTDGLFEIFRNQQEWFGYSQLLESIKTVSHYSLSKLYEAIMQRLSDFMQMDMLAYMEGAEDFDGQVRQLDDILFTGIEVDALPYHKKMLECPVSLPEISALEESICQEARVSGFQDSVISNIQFAVHEAIVNASEHGNKNDPDKKVFIKYVFQNKPEKKLVIEITDEGQGFDTSRVVNRKSKDDLSIRGRGVQWIKSMSEHLEYNWTGNSLKLEFHEPGWSNCEKRSSLNIS